MPKFEEAVVFCGPRKPGKKAFVPGSKPAKCRDCGAPIWVAPSSTQTVKLDYRGAKLVTVCLACADYYIARHPVAALNERQIDELLDLTRPTVSD